MIDGIRKAIFFGAHTDDEFVAAGTLHRLVRQGAEVHIVTFGPAAVSTDREGSHESLRVVVPEWHAALDAIGVRPEHRKLHNFVPSSRLATDYAQEIANAAYRACEADKPDAVFTLSPQDENTAHAVVGRETERVLRGRVPVAIRCQYPWNMSYGRGNLFVKLAEEDVEVKRKVIACYQSQLFRYKYSEMLLGICRVDGLSVKAEHAEKFEVVRAVV